MPEKLKMSSQDMHSEAWWIRVLDDELTPNEEVRWEAHLLACESQESTKEIYAFTVFEQAFEEFGLPDAIRTDNGHEFQAKFHWHVEDKGMRHVYIKPRSPQLNGKVERSHRSDQEEFYQLLTYTDDVDLNKKLAQWENFYNYSRPHGAFNGKTPYEALRTMLK